MRGMKSIVAALALGLLLITVGCGDVSEVEKTEQKVVCVGMPAVHDSVILPSSYALWYNAAGYMATYPIPESTIRWGAGIITRDYNAGDGNFATRCRMPYETVGINPSQPPVPGGLTGCQTVIKNTGGTCQWNNTQVVGYHDYFIYKLANGGYTEWGYDFKKVNQTGQVYRIDLNFPDLGNGNFQ